MHFVQFYIDKTVAVGVKLPKKVDGAILEIKSLRDTKSISRFAADECKKRQYDAWCVFSGSSIATAKPISCIYVVGKEDKTAFSAYRGA